MDEYVGKICPYCKTEIKEGEDVKVCPECGIPHHAACWEENKGCTMHLLRSTIARFYFSAKLLARSSQTLSATRTSFLSGCRKMTATALRMA